MGNLKTIILAFIIFAGLIIVIEEVSDPGVAWLRLGMLLFLVSIFCAVYFGDKFKIDGEPKRTIVYFAYGSNMLTQRIIKRCPSAKSIGTGTLENYEISFTKLSQDGSGKATIEKAGHTRTFGVLYEINKNEKKNLDEAEKGYEDERVWIWNSSKQKNEYAITYIAREIKRDLIPYDWYRTLIIAGAKQHNLPEEYIDVLQKTKTRKDPDENRTARMEALDILEKTQYATSF